MILVRVLSNEFLLGLYSFQRQEIFELRANQPMLAPQAGGSSEMNLQPEKRATTKAAQIMVEVIGPDGLVHHVGPFKSRDDARAWISRNSPGEEPVQEQVRKKFATDNRREPSA